MGRVAVLLSVCALAAPLTAAAQTPAPVPVWQAPTPAEGAILTVVAGTPLAFTLSAATPEPATVVHVAGSGLPQGAALTSTDGNPGTAAFRWTPTSAQLGDYPVAFTASASGVSEAITLRIAIRVTPELPVRLSAGNVSRSAVVLRPVYARAQPSAGAAIVTRVGTLTEEHAPNMVLALESIHDARGTLWVRVRLSILPNNSTGWVPRSALGPLRVRTTRLVIDRAFFTATLFRDGAAVFRTRIGVGRTDWPTPRGEFYVRELLTNFGDPFYGPAAFGTSAKSPVPTGYFAGAFIGIHGTNAPELIPGRISHGCIRLRNAAILRLVKLMPLGTPVTIR
jgi:lipoprotein-anchoring transpeptidase ErfK/SrfK